MTMHIYFKKDKDGYRKDWSGYVERSLARRFCRDGFAIPYQDHLNEVYEAEKAEADRKAALLAEKNRRRREKAASKKQKKSEKSTRK